MYFGRLSIKALFVVSTLIFSTSAFPADGNHLQARGSGLKVSNDPKKWPTVAQLQKALVTKRNGAFFWTGRTNGVSVEEKAAAIAAKAGGATLESSLARAGFVMPDFGSNAAGTNLWIQASKIFATGASGTTFCVQGAQLRPGNVFDSDELPILKKSAKVTSVVRIDGTTGAQTVLFQKSKLRRATYEATLEARFKGNSTKHHSHGRPRSVEQAELYAREEDIDAREFDEEVHEHQTRAATKKPAAKPAAKKAPVAKKPVAKKSAAKKVAAPAKKAAAPTKKTAAKAPAKKTAAKTPAKKTAAKSAAKPAASAAADAVKVAGPAPNSPSQCISNPVRCA